MFKEYNQEKKEEEKEEKKRLKEWGGKKIPSQVLLSEEQKEEQERLTKGDPKSNKKGRSFGQPFVPINEVPDLDSLNKEEKIDLKLKEKKGGFLMPKGVTKESLLWELENEYSIEKAGRRKEIISKQISVLRDEIEHDSEQKKINQEKMSKDIAFVATANNTAHVGPEFKDIKKNNNSNEDHNNVEDKFKYIKKGIRSVFNSFHRTTRQKEDLKPPKGFRQGPEGSKFKRAITGPYPKDNLKTIKNQKAKENRGGVATISKFARQNRGKIREILHDPKNYVEPRKKNPIDVVNEDDLISE